MNPYLPYRLCGQYLVLGVLVLVCVNSDPSDIIN
jgi:hypothetical protein